MLLIFRIIFVCSSLPVLLIGCKERCKESEITQRQPVSENVKGYFPYKTGNYWVYQNQDKSKSDSVYVSSHKESWNFDMILCFKEQNIYWTLRSSGKHFFQRDSLCLAANFDLMETDICSGYLLDDITSFYFPYSGSSRTNRFVLSPLETVVINKELYQGTLLQYANHNNGNLYLSKFFGIIGWVNGADTFNLVRYNIVK